MKKNILMLLAAVFVLLLPTTTAYSEPIPTGPKPAIIDGTAEVLFSNAQKISRNSAVKIEGLRGGHGSGTYVELDDHYLVITARHVVDSSEIYYISTTSVTTFHGSSQIHN